MWRDKEELFLCAFAPPLSRLRRDETSSDSPKRILYIFSPTEISMIIDIIGWIGSLTVIVAYALNMYKKLNADSLYYYLLNIFGSGCLIVNTIYHHAIPSTVVNIVWILIAGMALFKKKE
jgi:hypothetical protein